MRAQHIFPVGPKPSLVTPSPQSYQGLSQFSLISVAPYHLGPLLCILVPRSCEQSLELPQIHVAENVPCASLPTPPLSQPPQRGRARHHGGRSGGGSGIHSGETQEKVAYTGSALWRSQREFPLIMMEDGQKTKQNTTCKVNEHRLRHNSYRQLSRLKKSQSAARLIL